MGDAGGEFTVHIDRSKHSKIDIRVDNLSYTISNRPVTFLQKAKTVLTPWDCLQGSETKVILRNVNFEVKSGSMLAIMGSSGSGKTSLLDVLACRNLLGEVTGEVYLNGVARTRSMLDACSTYVRQDDRLLGNLTVKETLMFVAWLKLPTNMERAEVRGRVDSVMAELGLSHVADTKVGNSEIRGVSGGERRRISIGIQLLVDPSILFLDEPTSGLDSFTAHHLVETLEKLARNERTVLLSIHQPRSDIFEIFDHVLLLSRGEMVYFGEADKMVDYFTNLGYPCPELTNPCDHYMDLATVDTTTDSTESISSGISDILVSHFNRYTTSQNGEESALQQAEREPVFNPISAVFTSQKYQPGFFTQFMVLFRRSMRNLIEDYALVGTQILQALFMALVLGFVFYNLGRDQLAMRDFFGLMYMIGVAYPYMTILDVIGQCHKERNYVYFEMQDKLYSSAAYYFSKVLSELPFHGFYMLVYIIPSYFLPRLELDASLFFQVYGMAFFVVYCSRCLAMFSAALMPTFQISGFFAQSIYSIYIMSAGFFINLDNIQKWLRWTADVSYLRWGFEGLCMIVVKPLNFTCEKAVPGFCINTGEEALAMYAFRDRELWHAMAGMGANALFFLIGYFICLKFIPQKPHE